MSDLEHGLERAAGAPAAPRPFAEPPRDDHPLGGLRARDRHHLQGPAEGRVTRTTVPGWRPSRAPP